MNYRPMRAMFGIVVVGPLALALLFPNLVPQLESDSVPLFGHRALYSTVVALLVVLPFAAALLGLASRKTIRETEIARGIALGGGSVAVLALGIFVLMDLYALAFSGEHTRVWAARLLVCLVLLVTYAVMIWTARVGPDGWLTGRAGLAFLSVVLYAGLVLLLFGGADQLAKRKAQNYRHLMNAGSDAAETAVRSLTFCAISYLAVGAGRTIPNALDSLIRVAGCNPQFLDSRSTPEYSLAVSSSSPASPTNGCSIMAVFTGQRLPLDQGGHFSDGRTFIGDCSGVIREHEIGRGGESVVGPSLGPMLDDLSQDLERFSAEEDRRHYPRSLGEIRDKYKNETRGASDYLAGQAPTDLDNNLIRWGAFGLHYVPERTDGTPSGAIVNFHLQVRCESYAPSCMRNYLVDNRGFVHGTWRDREATDSDPIIEACELQGSSDSCDGTPSASVRRAMRRRHAAPGGE